MNYELNGRVFDVKRYPPTTNRSLQPWNAADELIIETLAEHSPDPESLALVNDRFGFLATTLFNLKPFSVVDAKSHQVALERNYISNSLVLKERMLFNPLKKLPKISIGVIKVPKAIDEFEFQIQLLHQSLDRDGLILCGFMTKYFTPQLLEIAGKYFEEVEQTKAKKKARLLILKNKKKIEFKPTVNKIEFKDAIFKQYPGVFSSDHIDYATQFFLEHLKLNDSDSKVLDLASGNGVIAHQIKAQKPDAEVHLLDDSYLAIESSKWNVEDVHFHWDESLDDFNAKSFDLIVSNPPFHFEYENNIEVSLNLFIQAQRCLKENGKFLLVANQHLNYKTHLDKIFSSCSVLAENDKFVIYDCLKS
jgi:16S rRNA G1207 methylase RsmC